MSIAGGLGWAYHELGNFAEAVKWYKISLAEAILINPGQVFHHQWVSSSLGLGQVFLSLGNLDDASRAILHGRQVSERNDNWRKPELDALAAKIEEARKRKADQKIAAP